MPRQFQISTKRRTCRVARTLCGIIETHLPQIETSSHSFDSTPLFQAEEGWARIIATGRDDRIRIRNLAPGMRIRVRPEERAPVDGVVRHGHSETNESVITGESRPLAKDPGSMVRAGSVNLLGQSTVECTAPASELS